MGIYPNNIKTKKNLIMELDYLRNDFLTNVESCYMVKNGKPYKLTITNLKNGVKDISDVQENPDDNSEKVFVVGFNNPHNKTLFKPHYAQPVIIVTGINNDGKLILSSFSKGGYDVPGNWMSIKGDFFISRERALEFIEKHNVE